MNDPRLRGAAEYATFGVARGEAAIASARREAAVGGRPVGAPGGFLRCVADAIENPLAALAD